MGHSIAGFLSANLRIPPTRLPLISPADCPISAIHFCVKIRKQAKQLSLRKVLSEKLFQSMYIERDCEHRQTTCRPLSPPTMHGGAVGHEAWWERVTKGHLHRAILNLKCHLLLLLLIRLLHRIFRNFIIIVIVIVCRMAFRGTRFCNGFYNALLDVLF